MVFTFKNLERLKSSYLILLSISSCQSHCICIVCSSLSATEDEVCVEDPIEEEVSRRDIEALAPLLPVELACAPDLVANTACPSAGTSKQHLQQRVSHPTRQLFFASFEANRHTTELYIWSVVLKNNTIYKDVSVQKITDIPDDLKAVYKSSRKLMLTWLSVVAATLIKARALIIL
ncbi:hypothetical protein VPH35_098277 [Triticum aestivum]|uniref:Putative ribonucleoside diphosphate reductase n=1 Tax=Triticum aestivum TaxID=4565 RepID=Q2L3T4_WHEAT|nr:putative ribonucleoside diphosphate reductase [Triticum aestivum]